MRQHLLIVCTTVAIACGDPAPSPPTPPARAADTTPAASRKPLTGGKAIYSQYCVACHGLNGQGNHGLGGDYREVLPTRTDAELMASIKNGKKGDIGTMPPWGAILSDDQIKEVLAYIRSEFTPPEAPEPEAAEGDDGEKPVPSR